MSPSEVEPFFPRVHLQNLKLRPWKRADVHATSNKKINVQIWRIISRSVSRVVMQIKPCRVIGPIQQFSTKYSNNFT